MAAVTPSNPFAHRSLLALWLVFVALWAALAIAPHDREAWALENVLVLLFGVVAWGLRHRLQLSRRAHVLLFVFMCLHAVGTHYTYSEVPYDGAFEALTGRRLNPLLGFERNHYDRLVHFAGGLLLTRPIREVLRTFSRLSDLGARIAALSAVMSASMLYELIEWGAAALFGGGLGAAFLGTQGDVWDAHKDMALASLGSLLAIVDRGLLRSGSHEAHVARCSHGSGRVSQP